MGDDDTAALTHQRRDLQAQRLAAAGGHQHQRIAAARDVLDDLALPAEKRREAEDRLENRESPGHALSSARSYRTARKSANGFFAWVR